MTGGAAPRVLITGASGFVGRHMCHRFLDAGWAVTGSTRGGRELPSGVREVVVDGLGPNTDWGEALRGVQTVVHLAARVHVMKDDVRTARGQADTANVQGTVRLAEEAQRAQVGHFILMSTVKVNGDVSPAEQALTEEDRPAPGGAYAVSKFQAEERLKLITKQGDMSSTIIRPPLVYGPGVSGNFRSMMSWLTRGVPLPLGAVNNERSIVCVDNLTHLALVCAESDEARGNTFFASDRAPLSTPELLRRLGAALAVPVRLVPVPVSMLQAAARMCGKGEAVSRLTGSLCVDISSARRVLSWRPPVSTEDGLTSTATAFRSRAVAERSR